MRTWLASGVAVMAVLLAARLDAAQIQGYDTRVRTNPDGSADVTVVLQLQDAAPRFIDVPVGFVDATDVRVIESPPGTTLTIARVNGQALWQIVLPPGATAATTLTIACRVPAAFEPAAESTGLPSANRIFKLALLNSQPAEIARYRLVVTFPDGARAQTIRDASPKLRKSEAGPRARLEDLDSRHGAWLQVDHLVQGETAALQIEIGPARRPIAWLAAGVLLSVLYLISFRDLVKR